MDPEWHFPFMSESAEAEGEGKALEAETAAENPFGGGERLCFVDKSMFGDQRRPNEGGVRPSQPEAVASPGSFWGTPRPAGGPRPVQMNIAGPIPAQQQLAAAPRARVGKFNAPPQFPCNVQQSEKYESWLRWKTTFDVALSICDGVPTDKQKTALLFTYIGDEGREIITMLSLPPMHRNRYCPSGEYEDLSEGLNAYFRTLVDESTDFSRYNARKQQANESVHTYAIKLCDLATRVGVARDSISFRHQFLSGLVDRDLAKKATLEGTEVGIVIQQAGRAEQAREAEQAIGAEHVGQQPVVMAMAANKGPSGGRKRRFPWKLEKEQTKWYEFMA